MNLRKSKFIFLSLKEEVLKQIPFYQLSIGKKGFVNPTPTVKYYKLFMIAIANIKSACLGVTRNRVCGMSIVGTLYATSVQRNLI